MTNKILPAISAVVLVALCSRGACAEDTILRAVTTGDVRAVKRLLVEKPVRVKERDKQGRTPLHYAATKGVAGLLLSRSAEVNAVDEEGSTPLHSALPGAELVAEFLSMLALEDSPAFVVVRGRFLSGIEQKELLVGFLADKGADVNRKDEDGMTPLIAVVRTGYTWDERRDRLSSLADHAGVRAGQLKAIDDAVSKGRIDIVKNLLAHKADVNAEDDRHFTALHYACLGSPVKMVKLLLEEGANTEAISEDGCTPLFYAEAERRTVVVEMLTDRGAKLKSATPSGLPKMHLAVKGAIAELLKLLDDGADVDVRTRKGRTPLHRAASLGKKAAVGLLISEGADLVARDRDGDTPLHFAVKAGRAQIVATLLDVGSDVNAKNDRGETPLHVACWKGHGEIVTMLLSHRAVLGALNDEGDTPLFSAARFAGTEVVEVLLSKGADVRVRNDDGSTPLHMVVEEGGDASDKSAKRMLELSRLFVNMGVDVNVAESSTGSTALHWAAANGSSEIVKFLLSKGADRSLKEKKGKTAFDLAVENKREDVVKILE